MTEPLTPQAIETLAAGYVVGDLDPFEAAAFEKLLCEDPAVAAEVTQLQSTLDRVAYDLNSVAPPTHLRSSLLTAAVTPQHAFPRQQRRVPWQPLVSSVAALLILYLGVENYQLRQDSTFAQSLSTLLQRPQTQLFSLKAVNMVSPATGSFVVNLQQRQGVLVLQNLAAPPANRVYRLWAIADGEKIPCGTLKTNAQGKVLEKFWMPADFYDTGISGLFVTLEASVSGRYPTGPVVIQSLLPQQ